MILGDWSLRFESFGVYASRYAQQCVYMGEWAISTRNKIQLLVPPGHARVGVPVTSARARILSLSYENMNPEDEMIIIREHEPG